MLLLAAALLALSAKPRFAIHGGNANGGTLYLPLFDAHQIEQVPVDKEGNFGKPETFQLPKSISPYEVVLSNNGKTLYCGGLIDQQRMLVALSLSTSGNIQQMLGGAEPATASLITMHPSKRYLYCVSASGESTRYRLKSDGQIIPGSGYPKQIDDHGNGECKVAWSPDGRFLYVATNDGFMDTQMGFTRIARTRPDGVLKPIQGTLNSDFNSFGATQFVISPDGNRALLCCLNDQVIRYQRNRATGMLKEIGRFEPKERLRIESAVTNGNNVYAVSSITGVFRLGNSTKQDVSITVISSGEDGDVDLLSGIPGKFLIAIRRSGTTTYVKTIPLDHSANRSSREMSVASTFNGAAFRMR